MEAEDAYTAATTLRLVRPDPVAVSWVATKEKVWREMWALFYSLPVYIEDCLAETKVA